MSGSYGGKVLWVDLSKGTFERKPLPQQYLIHLGGKALAARLLYESVPTGTDPLGQGNAIIFSVGPLNGTSAMFSAKGSVAFKSPLTGGYCDCTMGGYWAAELKYAGLDAIVIVGVASKPSYLVINNSDTYLMDADDLLGKTVSETEKALKEVLGRDFKVVSIGKAGEKQVRIANIGHEMGRQAGRGGAGAVMGSKNLKALAIFGTKEVRVSDPVTFEKINSEFFEQVIKLRCEGEAWTDSVNRYGTPMFVDVMNEHGILPTRNFQSGFFEDSQKISGNAMRKEVFVKSRGCQTCPISCGKLVRTKKYNGVTIGPEYETLYSLGSNCGINDIEAICKFNELCDEYGIDTISTGVVISFAMECYEKGYIGKTDVDGLDLKFGNINAVFELIEKIGTRKSVGELMGQGVKAFAKIITNPDAQKIAIHVKGLEFPGYDPRGAIGMALAYVTSDRGACHLRAWTCMEEIYGSLDPFTFDGKAELVRIREQRKCIMDSLIICDMNGISSKYADLAQAATGLEISVIPNKMYPQLQEDFAITIDGKRYHIGEMHVNIARIFNLCAGFTSVDDTLPERFFTEELQDGLPKGRKISRDEFKNSVDEYYRLHEWDANGVPTRKKLEELGIYDLVSGDIV
ncbi:MAG: aldehyde ferredoxin oxidoreductase family protein [Parabacteroides sp.]|nr:aldehyde ferredoxin oxidoreductase family protein [Eubacteriales bacterium]MDD4591117.1 aldehyde ferredoxin oxidoreductase family protein [Parabacteroides sp.]